MSDNKPQEQRILERVIIERFGSRVFHEIMAEVYERINREALR